MVVVAAVDNPRLRLWFCLCGENERLWKVSVLGREGKPVGGGLAFSFSARQEQHGPLNETYLPARKMVTAPTSKSCLAAMRLSQTVKYQYQNGLSKEI